MERQGIKAGAGKAMIQIPEEYLAAENFVTIHTPLYVRAVVIQGEETFVLLSIEMTSLPEEEVERIRRQIAEKYDILKENIWICVTHTFSAPHFLPDHILKDQEKIDQKSQYREALIHAALSAVETAYEKLEKAALGFGTGYCRINVNRDVELEDGWWLGVNEMGISDKTVSVIRINNQEEKPIALLYHYAIQSSVLDQSELKDGGKAVSSDITGRASCYVEAHYQDTVAMFLLGAAGDQAPLEKAVTETFVKGERTRTDIHEEGFAICEHLGNQLGDEVCHIAKTITCQEVQEAALKKVSFSVPGKEMNRDLKSLHPVREYTYVPAQEQTMEAEAFRLGDIALLGVKPELCGPTAAYIREKSPFPHTLVMTMINGAAKYMANEEAYDKFTYEAMNSPFGKGSAEILTKQAESLLKEIYGVRE